MDRARATREDIEYLEASLPAALFSRLAARLRELRETRGSSTVECELHIARGKVASVSYQESERFDGP